MRANTKFNNCYKCLDTQHIINVAHSISAFCRIIQYSAFCRLFFLTKNKTQLFFKQNIRVWASLLSLFVSSSLDYNLMYYL